MIPGIKHSFPSGSWKSITCHFTSDQFLGLNGSFSIQLPSHAAVSHKMPDNELKKSVSCVKRGILHSMTFYLRFRYSEDRWSLKHPFRGMEILIGVVLSEGSVSNFGPQATVTQFRESSRPSSQISNFGLWLLHLRAAFRDDKTWSCTNLYFEICSVEDLILRIFNVLTHGRIFSCLDQATIRKKVRPNGFAFSNLDRRIVPPWVRATILPTGVLSLFLPALLASTHRFAPNDFIRTTKHKPP